MGKINSNSLLVVVLCCMLGACQSKPTKESTVEKGTTSPLLKIEIIPAPGNTFSYNILKNGKIYIHQPHIPAISGNKGFKTEAQARKAAEFVILKIEKNIIPPTITAAELDSLGVLD